MSDADAPITDDWLRDVGFKWHQLDRQPTKHWLLWLGDAVRDAERRDNGGRSLSLTCFEDLGIELSGSIDGTWFCWFRSDAAGRYHRFIHLRHLRWRREVTAIVESLTGWPWAPENHLYGSAVAPEVGERYRVEDAKRVDRELRGKGYPWAEIEKDDSRGGALPEHLEAHAKMGPG